MLISVSGMVRYPKNMFDKIIHKARENYLSVLYYYTKDDPTLNEYHLVITGLMDKWGIKLKDGVRNVNSTFSVLRDISDLPKNYQREANYHPNNFLKVIIDWQGALNDGDAFAVFYYELDAIALFPLPFKDIISSRKNPKLLLGAFRRLEVTLEHELGHYVQFTVLSQFYRETKLAAPDYNQPGLSVFDRAVKYALSELEYEPTIRSQLNMYAARVHQNRLKVTDKQQALRALKDYLGFFHGPVTPTDLGSENFFFLALKTYDKPRWQRAVKKFTAAFPAYYERYAEMATLLDGMKLKRKDEVYASMNKQVFARLADRIRLIVGLPHDRYIESKGLVDKFMDSIPQDFRNGETLSTVRKAYLYVPMRKSDIKNTIKQAQSISLSNYTFASKTPDSCMETIKLTFNGKKADGLIYAVDTSAIVFDIDALINDDDFLAACAEVRIDVRNAIKADEKLVLLKSNLELTAVEIVTVILNDTLYDVRDIKKRLNVDY
jgi:hypothetical protein